MSFVLKIRASGKYCPSSPVKKHLTKKAVVREDIKIKLFGNVVHAMLQMQHVFFVCIHLCNYPGTAEGCLSWVRSRSVPPLGCGLSQWSTDDRSVGEPHPLLTGPPHIHLRCTDNTRVRNK